MSSTQEFLAGLGLPVDVDTPQSHQDTPVADQETDERLIPVADLTFTEEMVDGIDLETDFQIAYRTLFERFKSPTRNKDRNSTLHRAISSYLYGLRRKRRGQEKPKPTGHVKERIKATKEQREIAALLAKHNVSRDDLVALLTKEDA